MSFIYHNPLFSVTPPSNVVLYSNLSTESDSDQEYSSDWENAQPFTFNTPFSPIISVKSTKYYKNVKKLNYFYKGKKVKKLKI